jgi:16S rRNA (cytosine967-C5)-methyltransferase
LKYLASYLKNAEKIIANYNAAKPLQLVLKGYYKQNTKIGSKDRKNISQLVYAYYRLGNAFSAYTVSEKIAIGLLLTQEEVGFIVEILPERFRQLIYEALSARRDFFANDIYNIFPFVEEISEEIDTKLFTNSHLQQPAVFVRIRNGYKQKVEQQLFSKNISFTIISDNCLLLANNTKIDEILVINKEVVIQDYASQQVANFLKKIPPQKEALKVWDCCAASGGKSILTKDVLQAVELTISDNRASIIENLKKRLLVAGINVYGCYVTDATKPFMYAPKNGYDLIIADVPCSGSGTWSRTPEYLKFCTKSSIENFANLQKKIVSNVWQYVKKNGYLLYITCSVYKQENEAVMEYISTTFSCNILQMQVLKGYHMHADTMFACLIQKKVK